MARPTACLPETSPPETPLWRDATALSLLVAATLVIMANATISPALPAIRAQFADTPNAALLTRLLVPAPSLTVVFAAPLAGYLVDRHDRRALLLGAAVLFVLAGTAGLYLPSLELILASRFGLGLSVALLLTAQSAMIGDHFVGTRRSAFMGYQASARNLAGLLFVSLAGWAAAHDARYAFAIYALPLLFLPLMARARSAGEPASAQNAAHDTPEAGNAGRTHWRLGIGLLALLQAITVIVFFTMPTQMPFYLAETGRDPASGTALFLGVLMAAGGVAATLYGRVAAHGGPAAGFALGHALMAMGFAVIGQHPGSAGLVAASMLIGAGYGLATPGFVGAALDIAPPRYRGRATAVVASALFLGQFVSPILLQVPIESFGWSAVFTAAALLLGLLSAGAAWRLRLSAASS